MRGLRRDAKYLTLVRAFVDANPAEPLAETALNDLATYHILADADDKAEEVFEEILQRFPAGSFTDRAAWRAGWWAYRDGGSAKAASIFESAAVAFPRADYRPSWLYWSGRAHERLGHVDAAMAGYRRTISFYRNWYYGRQATRRADALRRRSKPAPAASPALPVSPLRIDPGLRPPDRFVPLIRALLTAELFEDAVAELRWTTRQSGSSPFIEASIAYALNRQGELRPAITAMRRAYPAFMAEGGEALPSAILKVIFPLGTGTCFASTRRCEASTRILSPRSSRRSRRFRRAFSPSPTRGGSCRSCLTTGRRYARRSAFRGFRRVG